MSDFLKPYICTQCGGKVNRTTLTCEMCGTQFKDVGNNRIVVVEERAGVHPIKATCVVGDEMIARMGLAETSRYAMQQLVEMLSQGLAPFIEVRAEHMPEYCVTEFKARIRLLDNNFKF